MIEDDLCLSDILGLSKRVFLEIGRDVERWFSDSDADDELDDALESGGDSCSP